MSELVSEGGSVSDQEKELSSLALQSFQAGDYQGCLASLEKLEVLCPTDVQLAHNKIVAQCRAGGSNVPLVDVVQQLEGLVRTQGLNLSEDLKEEDCTHDTTFLLYNLAVAKFQQRHLLQAGQLAAKLLPFSANLPPNLARKVLHLNAEISLALHQPEQALTYANHLETLLSKAKERDTAGLMVLKARCQVMAKQTKALKKELKSVTLPGRYGVTCEFVRSHIEFEHGNHRKSIKMLNSAVQAGGNKVFPHYYNNLGCIHQIMKKPNLAIYYFKNALEKLEANTVNGNVVPPQGGGQETTSWVTQAQVLYNIGISLLHARRPQVAFEILLEVVGAHYLDPAVWFHLAECCIQHHQPNANSSQASQVSSGGVGSGPHHKLVASNPPAPEDPSSLPSVPVISLNFAYICLKNAESLLPVSEGDKGGGAAFCEGVGYIGNPVSWAEVENLKVAVLAAKAYVALSLGDYIPAGQYALSLLDSPNLSPGYKLLGHLYSAESLILQDRLSEAIKHLNPDNIEDIGSGFPHDQPVAVAVGGSSPDWFPASGKAAVQYNLSVGYALREEWGKAQGLVTQLYEGAKEVPVQVLLLVLYLALRQGDAEKAKRVVRERCPAMKVEMEAL